MRDPDETEKRGLRHHVTPCCCKRKRRWRVVSGACGRSKRSQMRPHKPMTTCKHCFDEHDIAWDWPGVDERSYAEEAAEAHCAACGRIAICVGADENYFPPKCFRCTVIEHQRVCKCDLWLGAEVGLGITVAEGQLTIVAITPPKPA
jgi:hypothetical protein